jgi:hypothetical protein
MMPNQTPQDRVGEWDAFSDLVRRHITDYTIPQYGDKGHDELMKWDPEACINAVSKYVRRFGNNARGEQEVLRDMLKIAHFAAVAYWKMKEKK